MSLVLSQSRPWLPGVLPNPGGACQVGTLLVQGLAAAPTEKGSGTARGSFSECRASPGLSGPGAAVQELGQDAVLPPHQQAAAEPLHRACLPPWRATAMATHRMVFLRAGGPTQSLEQQLCPPPGSGHVVAILAQQGSPGPIGLGANLGLSCAGSRNFARNLG